MCPGLAKSLALCYELIRSSSFPRPVVTRAPVTVRPVRPIDDENEVLGANEDEAGDDDILIGGEDPESPDIEVGGSIRIIDGSLILIKLNRSSTSSLKPRPITTAGRYLQSSD